MTESEMREKILSMVREYCDNFHNQKTEFKAGDRVPYASRVYDGDEMTNLVDSALDFWLTAGRYVDEFEKNFAAYLGVKFCSVVNSGSSANLLAFMALSSLRRTVFKHGCSSRAIWLNTRALTRCVKRAKVIASSKA